MYSEDTYTDDYGRLTALTDQELQFFCETIHHVKSKIGTHIQIFHRDHEKLDKKNKEALGLFWTRFPKSPGVDCFITIDNYFIHECYQEKFMGLPSVCFAKLEDVLCHELAHAVYFRHGKYHNRVTAELAEKLISLKKTDTPSLDDLISAANKKHKKAIGKTPAKERVREGNVL